MRRGVIAACVSAFVLAAPALGAPVSTVTIAAAPHRVTFGSLTTLTGKLTGKHSGGATVSLKGKPAPYTGSFKSVASTTADATGHYTFKVSPSLNTIYHVVGKSSPPATSPDVLVKVRVKVTMHVSTSTPVIGHAVRFTGFVLPAYNGKSISIQRKTRTGWKTIARAKLVAASPSGGVARSKYSKRVTIRKSGTYRVRFNPADGLRIANNSRRRTLTARSGHYPPPTSGPTLDVPPAATARALTCPRRFTHPRHSVVLLVHGTGTTSKESWPDGFGHSLPLAGFDWCMVQLPDRALGDIQISAEYVVAAVRRLSLLTHRKVDLIGHSQGAVEIRWAVRFWPDVRREVDDLITLAGANNGVASASLSCSLGHCAPPIWQMRVGSALEAALNRIAAPPGPSYTAIYSNNDELIQPMSAGTFAGASNILIQSVCPGRWVEHAHELFDAVSIAIAIDALTHRGPAVRSRIPNSVCHGITGPGIDPTVAMADDATLGTNAAAAIVFHPTTTSEPPLRPYARHR